MADLAQVMISYLPEDSLHQLYELVLPLIGSLQPRPQKKAYQMLFHLISSNEPVCVGFVGCYVAEIAQSLADCSSCVCAGSRRVSHLILPLSRLHTHTHTHTHMHTHACTHARTHMHTHAHAHIHTHMHTHAHTHTCTHTHTHAHTHMRAHTHTHTPNVCISGVLWTAGTGGGSQCTFS